MERVEETIETEPIVSEPVTERTVKVTGSRHAPNVVERTVTDEAGVLGGQRARVVSTQPVITRDSEDVLIAPAARRTRTVVRPTVVTEHPQHVYESKKTIFRAYQVIWYILAVIEVLLAFRMFFRAIGANPYSGFVLLIYGITGLLTAPFMNIVPAYGAGNSVFEWSTVIAAAVYLLVAWGIVYLFQLVKPVDPEEVEAIVDNP